MRPIIEQIRTKIHSAYNNAKYLTTGNLPHNKACIECMLEYSLRDLDKIVEEERERCISKVDEWMRKQKYQEYPGGPMVRQFEDWVIENCINAIKVENK